MPKVPEAQQRVSTSALPGARFTTETDPNAFRGGLSNPQVGRSVSGLFNTISDIAQREKEKADNSIITIQENKVRSKMNEFLRGKTDENGNVVDPGYLSFSGLDADKRKTEYNKKLQDFMSEVDSEFTNERQKSMWEARKGRALLDFENSVESHAFKARMDYTEGQLKDSLYNVDEDAATNFSEPNKVQEALKRKKEILEQISSLKGLSGDSKDRLMQQGESSFHMSVLKGMMSGNQDLTAKSYFEENKANFTRDDLNKAQALVKENSLRGESQRLSESILKEGLSYTESLNRARNITDNPELKDEVIRRVKLGIAENKEAERIDSEARYQSAFNKIDADPRKEAVPEEEWLQLTPSQQQNLYKWIEVRKSGKSIQTDPTVYHDLFLMASNPKTKDAFMKTDILEKRTSLDNDDFKMFVKLKGKMMAGDSEAQAILDGYRSDKQVVDDALKGSGYDLRSSNQEQIKEMNQFRSEVDSRVQAYKTRTGKKYIDNKELQTIVDSMLIGGSDPDSGIFGMFKTKKKAFQIKPGEAFDLDPESIPQLERNKIEDSLKRNGKPVTEEAIQNLYLLKLKSKGLLE